MHKIFDPLGVVNPIVVRWKVLLQRIFRLKLTWDAPISNDMADEFANLALDLHDLHSTTFPRLIGSEWIAVHGFSDASGTAYGACVYVVVKGCSKAKLLCARSRVCPIRQSHSISRLELLASCLLSTLLVQVIKAVSYSGPVYCWVDSHNALRWITYSGEKRAAFIERRVTNLKSELPLAIWKYCPSRDNPADIISRGCSSKFLISCVVWWFGPSWLTKPAHWPEQPDLLQKPNETLTLAVGAPTFVPTPTSLFSRISANQFSSLAKLVRVVAYVLRVFSKKFRSMPSLSADEIIAAKPILTEHHQITSFHAERQFILRSVAVDKVTQNRQAIKPFC